MRYSLRTLIFVMLVGGPLCAFGWNKWRAYLEWKARQEVAAAQPISTTSLALVTSVPTFWEALTTAQQAELEQLDKEAIVTRR